MISHCAKKLRIGKMVQHKYRAGCVILFALIFMLSGCAGNQPVSGEVQTVEPTVEPTPTVELTPESTPTQDPTPVPTAEPTVEPTAAVSANEASSDKTLSIDALVIIMQGSLEESFDYANVEGNEENIVISVAKEGLVKDATAAKLVGNMDGWHTMKEAMKKYAASMYDLVQTCGHKDTNVMVYLLNDIDTDRIIVAYMNGYEIFDAIESE